MLAHAGEIASAASLLISALERRNKILIFGNGGSAADAQHLAAELVGRFEKNHHPLPAIALTTNTSVLTSIANDFDFNVIFSKQIEALGRQGDVAVAISTSGRSPNVLEGILTARRLGLKTIGLAGKDGGTMKDLVDVCLTIPSERTARIQEGHILIIHILCKLVEETETR
jgi:D-sedoheptulose 7-phosphate isomerase